jgi:Tol biopolymer transport system component
MSDRSKLIIQVLLLIIGALTCVAAYLALIPENERWPFVTPEPTQRAEIVSTRPNPIPPATPNPWVGVIDLDPRGLEVIQGYELWFSSLAGNRWQIWRLDSQTRHFQRAQLDMPLERQLLDQFVPAISPDGSTIALAIGPCQEGGYCARDLYLAAVDGGNVRRLTDTNCLDEFHPNWSPDGQFLTYFAGIWGAPNCPNVTHGIWVMDFSIGEQRQLTNRGDFDPIWSPSGRYIAYHSADPAWSLKVLDYQSCGATVNSCTTWVAADSGTLSYSAGWLNDSTLVFASDASGSFDIYSVPILPNQTLRPTRLTQHDWDDHYPAVSTDGKIMIWQAFPYYDTGDVGTATGKAAVIYVMDLEKGEPVPLITGIGNARDGFLRPLP